MSNVLVKLDEVEQGQKIKIVRIKAWVKTNIDLQQNRKFNSLHAKQNR